MSSRRSVVPVTSVPLRSLERNQLATAGARRGWGFPVGPGIPAPATARAGARAAARVVDELQRLARRIGERQHRVGDGAEIPSIDIDPQRLALARRELVDVAVAPLAEDAVYGH